jgi:hypothetical protein
MKRFQIPLLPHPFLFSRQRFKEAAWKVRKKLFWLLFVVWLGMGSGFAPPAFSQEPPKTGSSIAATAAFSRAALADQDLIVAAVKNLVRLQQDDGAWPYEGVYRVKGEIPVGYRVGGTAIVCSSLLASLPELHTESQELHEAIEKGTRLILKELEHPLMEPLRNNAYDVRIWGHIYALDYFCRLARSNEFQTQQKQTKPWIQKLTDAIVYQEIKSGGWNYGNQTSQGCFVTAPAVQALLWARHQGAEIPDAVLARAAAALAASRAEEGQFAYSGPANRRDTMPGSIARAPVSEVTLMLLGKGDVKHLQAAINAFHENWGELEKRRKKTGTHLPPHGIAPYYFYYGHRYLAQAIRFLPEEHRPAETDRFRKVLLKTKDDDHTWNDRVFEQSKAFGTAMAILALNNQEELPEILSALPNLPQ